MPILEFKFPEPHLFRGHFQPYESGDLLFPVTGETCLGDRGHFVFASPDRLQAAAYVFKRHAVQVGRIEVDQKKYRLVLIKEQPGKTVDDILNETGYFQKLSSAGFRGVFLVDRNVDGREVHRGPFEAVSREPEHIMEIEKIPCRRAMEWGVQLFSTQVRDPQEHDCWMRDVNGIGELLEEGLIRWENLRQEFDSFPAARPKALLKALGLG